MDSKDKIKIINTINIITEQNSNKQRIEWSRQSKEDQNVELCKENCCICKSGVKNRLSLIKTKCNHFYHKECLSKHILENDTCYLCSTNIVTIYKRKRNRRTTKIFNLESVNKNRELTDIEKLLILLGLTNLIYTTLII